ncbi:hypothetical protein PVAND_016888 [Polypedilum vanderplanki]|uniref:Aminopeptidase n=1 Tax=Polypedilum vanderplanki TaxID=319348 RepID=A0A9J6BGH2_POLVA|nr:hypothetical protein PVAND_016888 [Polypedilum vanderplanki]
MTSSKTVFLLLFLSVTSTWQSPIEEKETKNWKLKSEQNLQISIDDEEITTYRLPNNTLPVRYDIWLQTDVDKANFAFEGRVKIQIQAVEATDTVTLHFLDITIKNIDHIDGSGNILNSSLAFELIQPYEFLKIALPRQMTINEEFILHISYNGTLKISNEGFYRAYYVDYTTPNNDIIYYAVTQFESTDARHAFPCYDEPGIRAPIGLQIQHDRSYTAYSNMPVITINEVPGTNYVTTVFEDTPKMQTYLLAFLVSPFKYIANNDTVFPQKILAKPSSIDNGEADYAAMIADPILKKFINHLDVNFTLPKLDHAAITQFAAGAMENWGLITYRESALLLSTSYSESQIAYYRMYIAEVIAHEIAHQWTGNLVSPSWWTDLWLNEGFATLYECYIPHLLWPNDGYDEDCRIANLAIALRNDLPTSRFSVPMSYYVETPVAIDGRFSFVSYEKSGSVLKMFQEALSVETFTKGVSQYLKKMSFKAAVPDDLFSSLQEACDEDQPGNGLDIASIMKTWVYQAGYPLISLTKSGQNLTISQNRYPNASEVYSVPISFATKSNPDFENKKVGLWLHDSSITLPFNAFGMDENDWIIFNIQQTGYYRIAYDSNLWAAIARDLNENHNAIHLINRRVLQDELNIGYNTLATLHASDIFEFESYLKSENNYLVWNDAGNILRSLNTSLFNTEIYPRYLEFIKTISHSHMENVGLEATDGETADITQLRIRVKTFNCYAFDEDCLAHEHQKLITYMRNSTENPIPDFCSGFRHANSTIYAYYLEQLADNSALINRNRIVSNIGCSLNKNLLGLVVELVEDSANVLTSSERLTIIRNMLTTSTVGFEVAFAYIGRNIESISSYLTQLSTTVNTNSTADQLTKILNDAVAEGFLTEANSLNLKNSINANLAWQKKHYDSVVNWFKNIDETTLAPTTTTDNFTETADDSTTTPVATTTNSGASITASFILTAFLFFVTFK